MPGAQVALPGRTPADAQRHHLTTHPTCASLEPCPGGCSSCGNTAPCATAGQLPAQGGGGWGTSGMSPLEKGTEVSYGGPGGEWS